MGALHSLGGFFLLEHYTICNEVLTRSKLIQGPCSKTCISYRTGSLGYFVMVSENRLKILGSPKLLDSEN